LSQLRRRRGDLLKPIAVSLDKAQSNSCGMVDAVEKWKDLEQEVVNLGDGGAIKKLAERKSTALTAAFFQHLVSSRVT